MATTELKKKVTLLGRLETPMVTSKPLIKKCDYWIKIVGNQEGNKYPLFTSLSKLVKGERRAPTILKAYRGFVQVSCVGYNKENFLSSRRSLSSYKMRGYQGKKGDGIDYHNLKHFIENMQM